MTIIWAQAAARTNGPADHKGGQGFCLDGREISGAAGLPLNTDGSVRGFKSGSEMRCAVGCTI